MKAFHSLANFILTIHLFFVAMLFVYMSIYGFYDYTIDFSLTPYETSGTIESVWNDLIPSDFSFEIKFTQLLIIVIVVAVIAILSSINIAASGLTDSGSNKLSKTIVYITFVSLIVAMSSFFTQEIHFIGGFFSLFSLFVLWIDVFLRLGDDSN